MYVYGCPMMLDDLYKCKTCHALNSKEQMKTHSLKYLNCDGNIISMFRKRQNYILDIFSKTSKKYLFHG